ncbi:MAG TPA: HAMP domain-containing sensor histidine kinase [Ktedonobacteraceae bacterium]
MNEKDREAQVHGTAAPEVMAALIDLARLSQRVVSTAPGAADSSAALLLEHVLRLCGARRGALVLAVQSPPVQNPSFISPLLDGQKAHSLARLAMSEEEVLTRLAAFSLTGKDIQRPADEPSWVICRFPLSFPPAPQQDESKEQADIEQPNQTAPLMQAFLLAGWVPPGARISTVEREILPYIVDAMSAVIMNMLFVERLHELEAMTDRKAFHNMELLKAELLATVSHELRSPLSSIKGYAATLLRHERRIAPDERHEFLVAIHEASDRLATLIDRLLEMSQLDTGAITIERSPVNLARLIGEAIYAAEQRLLAFQTDTLHGQKQCTFHLRLEDGYGRVTSDEPVIQADRRRLREVLDNLLENAISYSLEDGVVEVVVRPVIASLQADRERTLSGGYHASGPGRTGLPLMQGKQRMIEMCVRDSGKGIPAEHLESIFERFHRVDTRLTREVGGLGLGLTVCKRIVELHGGAIWAESVVGQGSTFHVWLPM